jgi:hypothetical protein
MFLRRRILVIVVMVPVGEEALEATEEAQQLP